MSLRARTEYRQTDRLTHRQAGVLITTTARTKHRVDRWHNHYDMLIAAQNDHARRP